MPEASHSGTFQFATAGGLSDRAYKWWLTGVVSLAAVIRIFYVVVRLHDQVANSLDQYWYQNMASLVSQGKGISNPEVYAEKGILVPTALHLPFTSFLLVPLDLVGLGTLGEHQVFVAIVGTATVLILGMLAGRLVSRQAGVVTAFVAAVYPGMWGFDAKVMSEPIEQFLVALMLLFAYLFRYRPTALRGVCLGAIVGLAVLTRSELILEVPLLLVPLCIGAFKGRFNRELIFKAALVLGSVAVVVGPWIYYCETAFHDPEILSTDLGIGLIQDNNPVTYSGPYLGFWFAPASDPPPPGDESQVDHAFQHDSISYARSHESELPAVLLARVGRIWDLYNPFETADLTGAPACPAQTFCDYDIVDDRGEVKAWIWSFYGLIPFAVIGLVVLRRKRAIVYPLLSLAAVVTLVAIGEAGVLRFRAPFEDAFVVMAGIGLHTSLTWGRRRMSRGARTSVPEGPGIGARSSPELISRASRA